MIVFSCRSRCPRLGVPVPVPRRTSVRVGQRVTLRFTLLSLCYRRSHAGRTWTFAGDFLLSGQCWCGYGARFGTLFSHRSWTVWFTVSSRRLGAGLPRPSRLGWVPWPFIPIQVFLFWVPTWVQNFSPGAHFSNAGLAHSSCLVHGSCVLGLGLRYVHPSWVW